VPEQINTWLSIIALALGIINMLWVLISRGGQRLMSRIDKHSADLKEHDRRIQAVEGELKHMPTADDVQTLKVTAAKLEGHIERLDELMDSLVHTVRRIDDYLRAEK
jgi:hypothetical protein